ncbi:amidase [Mycobacterium sp. KBS0706]|uniref:amidase n=1 Tax=Mycobacterium sp. KBS0706 TaxID=2578109 RepID=UPI00110FB77E|nr:amidase [Mycobacterium sp. KBS0706]TSD86075.1 amidase [Mycobacterium sp. KBS0706]
MTSLADLSAVDLVARYRDRSLSPIEVTEAVLQRIEAWEPKLQALWALDAAAARAAAAASAARWAEGRPLGPVDGVPVTIKENIATKGVPVPVGTAATALVPAAQDAPPAARLRESGAVILAKSTMPDYGMLSSGLSSFHKLARNPWDLSTNPGGSSAGAGAAAAAGYGPIHLGTDIGGSIRLPASWCGIIGLKPSLGRIPIDPPYVGRVAGPMTRTVADTALAMTVLSRPDGRDGMNLPPAEIDWSDLAIDPKGLRIGLMMEIGAGMALDPEVGEAVTAAARLLAAAGAIVEPVPAILTREMLDGLDDFWRARAWDDVERLPEEGRAKILPYIRAWAESGAQRSGLAVMRGFNQTMAIRKAAATLFGSWDFVLSPTAPVARFPADWASPVNDPEKPFEHIGYTVAWNMSEQPAVSINCGYTKAGAPIGLQIVGRRFDDLGVLRLAKAYEDRRGPQRPWPAL